MKAYPKVKLIKPIDGKKLLVTFNNDLQKVYDCMPLLGGEIFKDLANESFFKAVKVDLGGYGVSWSDDVDLSESELWLNGIDVQ